MGFMACLRRSAQCLPPELAHRAAIDALRCGLVPAQLPVNHAALRTDIAGLMLPNPVGLAAGFDKNAETLPHIFEQGFGFVECGTVTPLAQEGNPKPRVFRLRKEESVINRLGFNNRGLDVYCRNLSALRPAGVVGANIGKNKETDDVIADYQTGICAVYPHADYITVNISSPNTQGLRDLQQADSLLGLIRVMHLERLSLKQSGHAHKPIFVKLAPDLNEEAVEAIARIALAERIDGLILTNTTIARPDRLDKQWHAQAGGLSGRLVFDLSTAMLWAFYRATGGEIPLIGVGGIASAADAYAKIRAGASAVQLYTALVYQGFELVTRINHELPELLARDGLASVAEAVGADHR